MAGEALFFCPMYRRMYRLLCGMSMDFYRLPWNSLLGKSEAPQGF